MAQRVKLSICYHFFEANVQHLRNLEYFLQNGIIEGVEYLFILASVPNIDLPKNRNIRFVEIQNSDFDYSGYKYAANDSKFNRADFHIFMNSGVIGPILPKYQQIPWTHHFTKRLNDKVKIIGTSIGLYESSEPLTLREKGKSTKDSGVVIPHVQSMFFCITNKTLKTLKREKLFSQEFNGDKNRVIQEFEIRMSQTLLLRGWSIGSLLPGYEVVDLSNYTRIQNVHALNGDPYFHSAYFGSTINPYDVIFFKTTRFYDHKGQYFGPPIGNLILSSLLPSDWVSRTIRHFGDANRYKTIKRIVPKWLRIKLLQLIRFLKVH